jgi:hypothetical protein
MNSVATIMARQWLRLIWRTRTDGQPNDPSLHANAVALVSGHAS